MDRAASHNSAPDLDGGHPCPCRCRPTHLGLPVDAALLNRAAESRLASAPRRPTEVDCLIIPGFTPRFGWTSHALHPIPAESCAEAARDLERGLADCVIVSGGAVHGPANEAVLMRAALLDLGVSEDRILVEPCARHTTTNLRNAARLMLAHGLGSAWVIAADGDPNTVRGRLLHYVRQSFYVGFPWRSSFHLRCRMNLGYTVGELRWLRPMHTLFIPSSDCLRESPHPTREGDA